MQFSLIIRTLGMLLLLFSAALLPPLMISLIYHDGESTDFALSLLISLALGLMLWLPAAKSKQQLRQHGGFIVVSMIWIIMSLLGSLPFIFGLHMNLTDAIFESVSAFTTTGATVIIGLDTLPKSILFFRQEMQWLGGIGVVVSAIALLPMLGVGGMQLYRAETPGPMKDDKLTPRISQTARALWKLYLSMTAACAVLYWAAGMSAFDAVAHSFSTVSTGGFSTHDASLAYFHSPLIEAIAVVFMLLGGMSFGVHYLVLQRRSPRLYLQNVELRAYITTVVVIIAVVCAVLYHEGTKDSLLDALRYSVFTVTSVITSTGFGIDDFSLWPTLLPVLLIYISFIGGCAGSTAGGMKVIRFVVLAKQVGLELRHLVYPAQVKPLKLDGRVISPRVAEAVWAFFGIYIAVFGVMMLLLLGQGMSPMTAFSAVATCLNNLGPGLEDVASDFSMVPDASKWIFSAGMLLGRLEIFTVFVLLTPLFWRK